MPFLVGMCYRPPKQNKNRSWKNLIAAVILIRPEIVPYWAILMLLQDEGLSYLAILIQMWKVQQVPQQVVSVVKFN